MTPSPIDPRRELSTEEKRSMLRKLLLSKIDPTSEPFPLTSGQRALWFLQSLVPESYAYNFPIALRFTPPINLAHLQVALDKLIARHPALRIQFHEEGGEPRQHAIPAAPVPIELREAPSDEGALRAAVIAESRRPFRLDAPLLRVTLWRGAASDVLLVTTHHLVIDGRSAVLFMLDFSAFYRAASQGLLYEPPPIPATYRDFVTAEEQLLASAAESREWAYWSEQLQGPWENLALPSVRQRPARMTLRGESISFEIPPAQVAQLKQLALSHRTTLYTVIYTAVQAVLYQFTGQTDFVIGVPSSARLRPEWDWVIGYFVNMLPIRAPLALKQSFTTQLHVVHERMVNALAHQQFPFLAMVERLKIARDPTRTPIFQAIVNIVSGNPRNPGGDRQATDSLFNDIHVEQYAIPQLEGQFDLSVELLESPNELTGEWKYGTDVLDADTATRMLDAFRRILTVVASHAELAELPMHELIMRAAQSGEHDSATDDSFREELSF